jgi:hypothetical protein
MVRPSRPVAGFLPHFAAGPEASSGQHGFKSHPRRLHSGERVKTVLDSRIVAAGQQQRRDRGK